MRNRREFLKDFAGATAGVFFVGCGLRDTAVAALQSSGAVRRREVAVNGRRVKTVDIHCHCQVPEVWDLIKDYDIGQGLRRPTRRPLGAGAEPGQRAKPFAVDGRTGI